MPGQLVQQLPGRGCHKAHVYFSINTKLQCTFLVQTQFLKCHIKGTRDANHRAEPKESELKKKRIKKEKRSYEAEQWHFQRMHANNFRIQNKDLYNILYHLYVYFM